MFKRKIVFAFLGTWLALSAGQVLAQTVTPAAQPDRFVSLAPCRVLDTRLIKAVDSHGPPTVKIEIGTTPCGRIAPTVATAYEVRVTTHQRKLPELPAAREPDGRVVRHPSVAPLVIAVAAAEHVTVDLEGFYVSPGTILTPNDSAGSSSVERGDDQLTADASSAAQVRSATGVNELGSAGDLLLDGSMYWGSGVTGVAHPSNPWTIMRGGNSTGNGGFLVFNTNGANLFQVGSSGGVTVPRDHVINGRVAYRHPTIQDNVVHEVRILQPRDSSSGDTTPVVFYNAQSDSESGSPETTKFRAFTLGGSPKKDINFDSQVYYHWPQFEKYHFRAYSAIEGEQRETFWVKAAANSQGQQTRADMYVSGNVGIGKTADANVKLDVQGDLKVSGTITGATVIGATYQDLAEWVPAKSDMTPGTVVVLNPDENNEVMPSSDRYDVRVAGVVSRNPGLILGVAGESKEQIATTGRVRVKVDARAGPIRIGDLLVTSDNPGRAMRSDAIEIQGRKFHQPGTIIGKALEPLAGGEGEILVLLSLQ